MNWADYIILAIILLSALLSVGRGFVREVLSLLGWVAALWVSISFSPALSERLYSVVSVPSMRRVLGFLTLFIATLLLAAGVNYLITKLIIKKGLSSTDRALGILFGMARGIAIVAIMVLMAGLTPLPQDPWWKESLLL
ncbi:MAG TPA: CvpA family protein, partial [Gammaproteobacteria bacterium]|nr:CvpA family protein [Gammaproteobacteria bacterium]